MQLSPEEVVLEGRFKIVRLLGTGGMGEVYQAEQISLGRPVAIKVLKKDMAGMHGMSDRFVREAKMLSAVDHPSIIRVIDFGEWKGSACLVMEYVDGKALDLELREGPLVPDRALRMLLDLAEGLCAIHDKGIIHRDLNPKNVVLTQTALGEKARLLDFGIARLVESSGPAVSQVGMVIGTPEYLSPEQARGSDLTSKTDLYSFGVLAYEALAGTLPFEGPEPLDYMKQHASVDPKPLAQAAPHLLDQTKLCDVVMRCLQKDPARRPDSAKDLLERLRAVPEVGEPTLLSESVISQPIQLEKTAVRPVVTAGAVALHPDLAKTVVIGESGVQPAKVQSFEPSKKEPKRRMTLSMSSKNMYRGIAALGAFVVLLGMMLAFREPAALKEIRALVEEKKGKEALAKIEASLSSFNDSQKISAELYRAVALHHMNRHREELSILGTMKGDESLLADPLVLGPVFEDYGRTREHTSWKSVLEKFPEGTLRDRAEEMLNTEPPLRHWGALRYLDLSKGLENEELVQHYLKTLEGNACGMKMVAAKRLGELGDPSAEAPLKKVRSADKENCGQEEAGIALAALKKSASKN
jgi:serine/threonine protein kinase